MSMEQRNNERDWKAPVALVLAGLALFIALGDRNLFGFGGQQNQFVEARPWPSGGFVPPVQVHPWPEFNQVVPVAPTVVPAMPPGAGSYIAPEVWADMMERKFAENERIMGQVFAVQEDSGPRFWQGRRGWFGPMLILFALGLIFVGWRVLQNRNRTAPAAYQAPPPPPPAAPPPPGYGPGTPPPPGPPYYGDISQRQVDS